MRVTLHTDYALRMLAYIALHPAGYCTVNDVADAYNLSHHHLMKVAQRLRQSGFIETTRGRAGGIRLAVTPDKVNIGAVVRATEDDFALVECMQSGGGGCAIARACHMKDMFVEALTAYLAVLDKYTLGHVMHNRALLRRLLGIASEPA
ncbi:Rrf2 family transcriptional regulator [Roseiarcaceae bacterium H3SJ34-1]|uniref:RrF2 family transcriptional regulator n=1 Tax=Terripilifer ovatus TaxID=3032367 RepID=UPI003AB93893|nr:Rrf2 family transcriptional regulator [Roseiarcaceae bacterium H3SJ34-1]